MRTDYNRMLVTTGETGGKYTPPRFDPYMRRQFAEMIVGIVIVAICLYLFIPVVTGTGESSRRAVCAEHMRRLAQAMEMYQLDSDGQYPPTDNWVRALVPYVVRPAGAEPEEQIYPQLHPKRSRIATRPGAQPAVDGMQAFFCPSEENLPHRRTAPFGTIPTSYSYRQPPPVGNLGIPFGWDYLGGTGAGAHPNGGNVAYLDGRVLWRPASQWAKGDQP